MRRLDGAFAGLLGHVAVERLGGEAVGGELLGDLQGSVLGAHEDQHGVEGLDLQDPSQDVDLVVAGDHAVMLLDGVHGGGLGRDLDLNRVAQVGLGNLAYGVGHGRREEGDLPAGGGLAEDPLDVLGEAHVEHLVGLVQDQGADALQVEVALTHVVHDSPGRPNDDVGAALQLANLHAEALTAVERQDLESGELTPVAVEGLGDLQRQFPGGGQDQDLGVGRVEVDAADQGHGEGGCLAGASLGLAEDVSSCHDRRDALGLDGCRDLIAQDTQGLAHRRREAEGIEALGLGGRPGVARVHGRRGGEGR